MKEDLFDHEADCDYRIVNCPDLGCREDISFLKMLDHLDEEHAEMKMWNFDKAKAFPIVERLYLASEKNHQV